MVPGNCYLSKLIKNFAIFVIASLIYIIQPANGYLDVNQYCKAFDVNFRPIICIIKNGTQTAPPNYHPPRPPPPHYPTMYPILQPPGAVDYTDIDDDDDDCSCEVTCIPRIVHQRSLQKIFYPNATLKRREKRTSSTSYRCKSCGTECPVSTTRPTMCNCVIPASKSECSCTATCATFRNDLHYYQNNNDDLDDANCILSVTALEDWRLGEERPPYSCDCKRSKEAENTTRPDFICICQRVSRD